MVYFEQSQGVRPLCGPRVSILVLMDGVLRALGVVLIPYNGEVSILVLMDGVLRGNGSQETERPRNGFQSLF